MSRCHGSVLVEFVVPLPAQQQNAMQDGISLVSSAND